MRCALLGAATAVAVWAAAGPARASVTQPAPDSTPVPQPANPGEVTVVEEFGFSADAVTLAGLFNAFNGGADAALDPIADASTTPGSFPAQCGFKVQLVLKGGACPSGLGWYNATDPATTPTAIYPVVPSSLMAAPPNGIGCNATDFCPLANRTGQQRTWADPLPAFDVDVRSDPNWAGGAVGFALVPGAVGSQCSETKYSQADLNDKSSTGAPWITALIYHSKADAGGYYVAFEDLPMCAASWRGCSPGTNLPLAAGSGGNDSDFNDDVFYVTGLDCSLAGGAADGGVDASGSGTAGAGGVSGGAAGAGAAGAGGAGATGAAGHGGVSGGGGASMANGGTVGATGTAGAPGPAGANGSAGQPGATGLGGAAGSGGGGVKASGGSGCGCGLAGPGSPWATGLLFAILAIARRRRRATASKRDH